MFTLIRGVDSSGFVKIQCLFVYKNHYRLHDSTNGFKHAPTLEGRLANGFRLGSVSANALWQLVNLNSCLSTGELQTSRTCRAKAVKVIGPRFCCEWDCPTFHCHRTEMEICSSLCRWEVQRNGAVPLGT